MDVALACQFASTFVIPSLLWLQPLHNLNDDNPVRSQPYSEVLAVARRRHSLRPIGLEIFFKIVTESGAAPGGGVAEGASAFFTFRDSNLRDQVVSMLLEQLGVNTYSHSWKIPCFVGLVAAASLLLNLIRVIMEHLLLA